MTSGGGGGYCDCGDPEAWKQYHCCEIHSKKTESDSQTPQEIIEKLPAEIVQRARQLFEYLLEYITDMLCGRYLEELPTHLKPP